jgi:hypothetical protein
MYITEIYKIIPLKLTNDVMVATYEITIPFTPYIGLEIVNNTFVSDTIDYVQFNINLGKFLARTKTSQLQEFPTVELFLNYLIQHRWCFKPYNPIYICD